MNLAQKYALNSINDIIGHDKTIDELKARFKDNNIPQTLLISGISGAGKSTLAYIISKSILCRNKTPEGFSCNECPTCKGIQEKKQVVNFYEYNASNINIEKTREIEDIASKSFAFTKTDVKVFFINEMQELSKNQAAMKNLLDILEKPLKNTYFILVTMDESKINTAIKRRAVKYTLNPIPYQTIATYLAEVCKKENIEISTPEHANALITLSENCMGSIGVALPYLERIIYSNLWDEKNILNEIGIASGKTVNDLLNLLLSGNPELLSYSITEDTITSMISKLVWVYALFSGVSIERWKKTQVRGINKVDVAVIEQTLLNLNSLKQYIYTTESLIQTILIKIINLNKR